MQLMVVRSETSGLSDAWTDPGRCGFVSRVFLESAVRSVTAAGEVDLHEC